MARGKLSPETVLAIIKEHSEDEYQDLIKSPKYYVEDYLDDLGENYPTEKELRAYLESK